MENKKEEQNQEKEEKTKKEEIKVQDRMSFIWVILRVGAAILVICLLSLWIYKRYNKNKVILLRPKPKYNLICCYLLKNLLYEFGYLLF